MFDTHVTAAASFQLPQLPRRQLITVDTFDTPNARQELLQFQKGGASLGGKDPRSRAFFPWGPAGLALKSVDALQDWRGDTGTRDAP